MLARSSTVPAIIPTASAANPAATAPLGSTRSHPGDSRRGSTP